MVARVDSMLERIRDEKLSILVQIFADNFAARALKDARSRIAGRPDGPYKKIRVLKHHVFACARSPSPEALLIFWPVWFSANCRLVVYVQCINTDLLCPTSVKVGLVNALNVSAVTTTDS